MSCSSSLEFTQQLKQDMRKFLYKVEASIFPISSISSSSAAPDTINQDFSFASYSAASTDVDKLILIHRNGPQQFRADALVFLATLCNDQKNHSALCELNIHRDLCLEMSKISSVLLPVCVTAISSLASSQSIRESLRLVGINSLVLVLCNPNAINLREIVLRTLAMMCTNNSIISSELVKAGAISALANIVRKLLPEVMSQDDPMLTNSLWTLATVSCAPESHLVMLKEGLIDLLVSVLEKASSTTYCDYSLSCLLQLTACEECRQLMVTFKCQDVLTARIGCGFPTIVRRSLQVMANLCVDETSRSVIASIPHLFETIIASSRNFDPLKISSGQADARSLLQCLKLLSNLIQTEKESNSFRDASGVQWFTDLAAQYEKSQIDPSIEQQIGHLAANILIHEENHNSWVSLNGIPTLKLMLQVTKQMPVRREAARAVSNLVAFHDDIRDIVFNSGIVSCLIESIRKSLVEQNPASQLQLLIFSLRAIATLALSHHRTTELVGSGIFEVIAEISKVAQSSGGNIDEISGVLSLSVAVLSNMAGSFDVSRNGDVRNSIIQHKSVGINWVHSLIKSSDHALQFQAMKLFVQLITTWRGREWIHTNQIDPKVLGSDGSKSIKHLRHYTHILEDINLFSHDITLKMPETTTSDIPQARRESRAIKMDRRARHKAVMLTTDQLKALSIGTSPQENSGNVIEPNAIRFTLLNEFLTTERRYANCLSIVRWKFERPLLGLPPNPPRNLVSSTIVRNLFSALESVSEITNAFLDILENRARENGQFALVGDVFLQLSSVFNVYVKFAESFPQALSILSDVQRKSSSLANFIERTEKSPHCNGRTLRSFLEMPLERPQGYIAFLSDYISATADIHPDNQKLKDSLQAIQKYHIRRHDPSDLEKIISVEQRIKGHIETLVAPGRTFVKEARLVLLAIGEKPLEAPFDIVLFLFSDLLVVTKVAKQDRCKLLDRMPLSEVIVGTAEDELSSSLQSSTTTTTTSSSPPKLISTFPSTCFKVQRCTVGSTIKSGYIISAPTIRDQKSIVDSILQAQTATTKSKKDEK